MEDGIGRPRCAATGVHGANPHRFAARNLGDRKEIGRSRLKNGAKSGALRSEIAPKSALNSRFVDESYLLDFRFAPAENHCEFKVTFNILLGH